MDERGHSHLEQADPTRSTSFTTLATFGAAGLILLLGAGAAYFLTRASPEALATTARLLVTTGLLGLVVMTFVAAVRPSRRSLPRRDGGGGPGRVVPQPIPIRPSVDPDAELFRILDDDRLGDISTRRRAHLHDRRHGAA
jgi:hypothetical protein